MGNNALKRHNRFSIKKFSLLPSKIKVYILYDLTVIIEIITSPAALYYYYYYVPARHIEDTHTYYNISIDYKQ